MTSSNRTPTNTHSTRITHLSLEDDYLLEEEDIGTTESPYYSVSSSLASASSGASSATLSLTPSRNGSVTGFGSSTLPPRFVESLDTFPTGMTRSRSQNTSSGSVNHNLSSHASYSRSSSSLNPSPSARIAQSSFSSPSTASLPHTPRHELFSSTSSAPPQHQKLVALHRPSLGRSNTMPTHRGSNRNERRNLVLDDDVISKLRRWIMAIVIVEFDLDHGPMLTGVHPPLDLLPAEEENIAFLAFPDSLQFDQGSQIHSFRLRKDEQDCDGSMYGFSHFTQKRDPTSKRGYQQSSVIILTQHQYPALFYSLASILGPLYQNHGLPMIESACHNISGWSDPAPGTTVELGFLGTALHVEIPHSIDAQQLTETSSFNEKYDSRFHILATSAPFHPPPLMLFEASLPHLWSIWECLLLCEPLLIFGSSPAQTSQAVWWLRDLLRPIPISGRDLRPYLTMQDQDLAVLINKLPPKPGIIVGVTNPFFERECGHWPHVLSLGRRPATASTTSGYGSPTLGQSAGPAPGWKTKTHKRYISKDRVLLKQLEAACKGDEKTRLSASLDLRRHFCSRTTQFMTPLARYLNTLIPNPAEVQRARFQQGALRLKPFSTAGFLESLKKNGSPLPFKSSGKRTEFYERWLKSPAFGAWLVQQEAIVQKILNSDEKC